MKKYTVLVLRPDYIASDYGQGTYLAHVEAVDVLTAQEDAQRLAYQADVPPDDDDYDESAYRPDYYVLAVFEGYLNNVAEEA